ncbi:hypothetical protein QBC38DRAFT_460069, partial [Podospora fimiseda]
MLDGQLGGHEASTLFVYYLKLISQHVEHLKKKLDKLRSEDTLWTGEQIKEFFNKVKFALSESTRNGVFTDMSECNKKLERLTKPITTSRPHSLIPTRAQLESFAEHANQLYSAISSIWSCECQPPHLNRCGTLILTDRGGEAMSLKSKFDIIFKSMGPTTNLWPLTETKIEVETIKSPRPNQIRPTRAQPLTGTVPIPSTPQRNITQSTQIANL